MSRILILYIVRHSGHHAAARCLEETFIRRGAEMQTRCIDLLQYTHPKWARIIERMYMTTIRRTPELWEALYDNFWVEHLTRRLRLTIQRGKSDSLRQLMAEFKPDAVVCTQAYPLAVMAAFTAREGSSLPLFGVTTDFVPHRFWIVNGNSHVRYVVPTESAAARLMWLGVDKRSIRVLGIPVRAPVESSSAVPFRPPDDRRVLVMGGGRGIGIRYRTVRRLDLSSTPFTIDVVCGTNRTLRQRLVRHRHQFRHPIRVRGYVYNTVSLMSRADLMITKAGGMTLAEALSVGRPLLLVRPLPGQETGNTKAMVHAGAALYVKDERHVARSVTDLLSNENILGAMRAKALAVGRPDAAERIVDDVLGELEKRAST